MTVTISNFGGGSGGQTIFPPKGTQLQEFVDSFERANLGTLGTEWANQWFYCDFPYSGNNTPDPMSTALSPRIAANTCTWGSVRGLGGGADVAQGGAGSVAFPWKLAWLTQGQFDQFSEVQVVTIDPTESPDGGRSEVSVDVVFSGAAGSLTPDTYLEPFLPDGFQGQYGYYSMNIGGTAPGAIPGVALVWNLFGASPSFTPTGLRGHAGVNFVVLTTGTGIAAFPSVFRIEARRLAGTWNLRGFQNGVQLIEANDNHLLQGQPAISCSTPVGFTPEQTPNPQFIAEVRHYRGGML